MLTREGWIRRFFSEERVFQHYSNEFRFEPIDGIAPPDFPHLLFGWLARQVNHTGRTAPEDGLEPTSTSTWQVAFIAIDPTDHSNGQLVAVENNPDIGGPKALMRALVRTMNDVGLSPYHTQVFPLVSSGSFWQFASEHRGEIVSLTFDVAAPNMFNDANDFQDELRALRDKVNVSEVSTTLVSDTALKYESDQIRSIVDYVERGAGDLAAVSADGSRYSSTQHERTETVDIESHNRNPKKFLRDIMYSLARFFE